MPGGATDEADETDPDGQTLPLHIRQRHRDQNYIRAAINIEIERSPGVDPNSEVAISPMWTTICRDST